MTNAITGIAPHNSTQAALASGSQVSVVPGALYGLAGYNSAVAVQFIQLHDSASAPANGAVPAFNISVPAGANYSVDFGVYGMNFVNGIYACNSSTPATKTSGAADCQFFARVSAV
jgi:hypothetical protein